MAIAVAALPIGLLADVPSVLVSAVGLSVSGAGLLAETRQSGAPQAPIDRLRVRVFLIAWLVILAAAAATLLA